ncbi:MAG: N-acetylmuramidase family protein [Bacteroidales bacterium]|jgi:hypothetical protein|nr:N-acetylmuramidase family protein [Bacteroidales bacterium]
MNMLRKGSAGTEVSQLQRILQEKGYPVKIDGIFGSQTYLSVCQFQKSAGLPIDGIVGKDTWNALSLDKLVQDIDTERKNINISPEKSVSIPKNEKQEINFRKAAEILGIEEAAIRAVHQVESGGRNGFLPDGRPIILFEGHIFWSELKKRGINPENHVSGNEDILFLKWNRSAYKGGTAEYERLNRAIAIHRESALSSASWGMFQIMGFNYKLCGCNTISEYVSDMEKSADKQFLAFIKFLQNTKMDILLKNLNWVGFAEKYNGPGYKQNHYDEKLEHAYQQYKNEKLNY